MKVKIMSMSLRNFKGLRKFDVTFGDNTTISGKNAAGKTTLFDAFMWLFFNKNSNDAKDFNIKTLDKNNQPIHRLEHEVNALLDVDGIHVSLRKIYREKWVKKRGLPEPEFTGHETEYFIDDVPLSLKEYQARVDFILREDIAKLVTNPLYFNQMKWQDRRKVLEAMAGEITNEYIVGNNETFKSLVSSLGNYSLFDFKRKISAAKSKIKETLQGIPTRIDEVDRSKPKPEDYAQLSKDIYAKEQAIAVIDSEIEGNTAKYERELTGIRAKQKELNDLKLQLMNAETANKSSKATRLADIDGKIRTLQNQIRNLKEQIANDERTLQINQSNFTKNSNRITELNTENDSLREKWEAENAKVLTIDPNSLKCSTCHQDLPAGDKQATEERLTTNFNNSKASALKRIEDQGQQNKATIEQLTKANVELSNVTLTLEAQVAQGKTKVAELEHQAEGLTQQRTEVSNQETPPSQAMTDLQAQIEAFVIPSMPPIDNAALKQRKEVIQKDVDALKLQLGSKDQIAKIEQRIVELQEEERTLSQHLADLERQEFVCESFSRAKIEAVEAAINHKFKMVKFKMFQTNINGGIEEICETLLDGVPYQDVNQAGQINAGIDILNALSEHYEVYAPVWVDRRESIIELIPCKSQIISLKVVEELPLTVTCENIETVASIE